MPRWRMDDPPTFDISLKKVFSAAAELFLSRLQNQLQKIKTTS